MTANEAVGAKVNQLMFRNRTTRKQLAEALGITGAAVSRKIYGQNSWTLEELYSVADFFNITVTDLLPRRVPHTQETPDSLSRTEGSDFVAGAGFEPTTSGLWSGFNWRKQCRLWSFLKTHKASFTQCYKATFIQNRITNTLYPYLANLLVRRVSDSVTPRMDKHPPVSFLCLSLTGPSLKQSPPAGKSHYRNLKSCSDLKDALLQPLTPESGTSEPWRADWSAPDPQRLTRLILFTGQAKRIGSLKHETLTTHQFDCSSGFIARTTTTTTRQKTSSQFVDTCHLLGQHQTQPLNLHCSSASRVKNSFYFLLPNWDLERQKLPKSTGTIFKSTNPDGAHSQFGEKVV